MKAISSWHVGVAAEAYAAAVFARYGYTFSTKTQTAREAKNYFENLDWYRSAQSYCTATEWETVRSSYMNDIERENINRINAWQQDHGVYY